MNISSSMLLGAGISKRLKHRDPWTSFRFKLVLQVVVLLLMMVQNGLALLSIESFRYQSSLETIRPHI